MKNRTERQQTENKWRLILDKQKTGGSRGWEEREERGKREEREVTFFPFSTLKTANDSTLCHCLEIFIQWLLILEFSLPLVCHLKRLLPWILQITLDHKESCSAVSYSHGYLAISAMFLIFRLFNPRPPSPWDLVINSHFTRWFNLNPLFPSQKKLHMDLSMELYNEMSMESYLHFLTFK